MAQNFLMQFFWKFWQNHMLVAPLLCKVGALSYGESWIRNCLAKCSKINYPCREGVMFLCESPHWNISRTAGKFNTRRHYRHSDKIRQRALLFPSNQCSTWMTEKGISFVFLFHFVPETWHLWLVNLIFSKIGLKLRSDSCYLYQFQLDIWTNNVDSMV